MPVDRKDILKQQERLGNERALEEGTWRELCAMLRPDDRNFSNTSTPAQQRDDSDMFDATPLYALDDFAKGLFKQAANPASRWFEFGLSDTDLAKFGPVKEWLYDVTNITLASLDPEVSRFYTQVRPWFANLGTLGWGALWQEEIVGRQRINDRSLPIGQCYFDVDDEGNLYRFHRVFVLKDHQVRTKFGDVNGLQEGRPYKFVHAVYPNPDANPERLGARYMAIKSCYVCHELPDFERESGYEEFPVHIPMWNEREGSAYPTGPGHDARADIATLNEMERSNLVMAQFAAEPPVLFRDDSAMTAAHVVPNAGLYGAINEQGKPNVAYLDRNEKQVISLQMAEQKRNAIRRAFAFSLAQLVERPQMTATEFDGWQMHQLEQAAPNLVNVQHGGLAPFLQRRYRILTRAGQYKPAPPELSAGNAMMKIKMISPLAKAQKLQQARSATGWINTLMPVAELKPEVLDNVDVDGYARVTHDAMSGVPDLILDPRVVAQTRQQRQQQQAEAMEMEKAATAAAVYADAAHAQQASTLSKQRAGRAQ